MRNQRLQRAQVAALLLGARAAAPLSRRLSGWFTAQLWFTPWEVPRSPSATAREDEWLASTRPRTWSFRDGQLRGFEAGDGPAVLLIHGWGDRASVLGGFITPLVTAGYRVVALDLPGHGDSAGGRTHLPEAAQAITAVAQDAGGVHAVVAHSLGGAATIVALNAGLQADRVALLAPSVRLDHAVGRFTEMFNLPPAAIEGLRNHIERRFGASVWEDFACDSLAASLPTRALVIHDADDTQVDPADSELLVKAWPSATLVRTRGLGHRRVVRNEAVVSAVVAFLGSSASAAKTPAHAMGSRVASPDHAPQWPWHSAGG